MTDVTVEVDAPETSDPAPQPVVIETPPSSDRTDTVMNLVERVTRLEDTVGILAAAQEATTEEVSEARADADVATEIASDALRETENVSREVEEVAEAVVATAEETGVADVPEVAEELADIVEDEPPTKTPWHKRPLGEWFA